MNTVRVAYADVLPRYAIALATTAFATAVALTISNGLGLHAIGLLAFPMLSPKPT